MIATLRHFVHLEPREIVCFHVFPFLRHCATNMAMGKMKNTPGIQSAIISEIAKKPVLYPSQVKVKPLGPQNTSQCEQCEVGYLPKIISPEILAALGLKWLDMA